MHQQHAMTAACAGGLTCCASPALKLVPPGSIWGREVQTILQTNWHANPSSSSTWWLKVCAACSADLHCEAELFPALQLWYSISSNLQVIDRCPRWLKRPQQLRWLLMSICGSGHRTGASVLWPAMSTLLSMRQHALHCTACNSTQPLRHGLHHCSDHHHRVDTKAYAMSAVLSEVRR